MSLKHINILFDSPWNIYYPGQNVTGRVVIQLNSALKVKSINVKIRGHANTSWISHVRVNNERKMQTVSAYEEYFKIQYYLLGSDSGNKIELPPGEHVYPFTCALPLNLPSSLEADLGHIRYTVKVILDRSWKFNYEAIAAFTIVSFLDLNLVPQSFERVQQEMSKTFCCFCCGSPPLTLNFFLPAKGYVPGQEIPVKIIIENQSGIIVDKVKLILLKIVTFHTTTPRKEIREVSTVISEVSKGPVAGNSYDDYEQTLKVPPLPSSNLTYCGIINVQYYLKVEACMSGWYRPNLSEIIPIYIGTIPLSMYQMSSAPMMPCDDNYMTKPNDLGFVIPPTPTESLTLNLHPNLPPHGESMSGAQSLQEKGESENILNANDPFVPRYPVYNFMLPRE